MRFDEGGTERNAETCRGRRRVVIIVIRAIRRPAPVQPSCNHATPATKRWRRFTISSRVGSSARRARPALARSHRFQRSRHCRAAAMLGRFRPPGRPKSTTPGPPSSLRSSASDRSRRPRGACRSPPRSLRTAQAIQIDLVGKVVKLLAHLRSPQSGLPAGTGRLDRSFQGRRSSSFLALGSICFC